LCAPATCARIIAAAASNKQTELCFASRGPEREVGHARQPVEVNATHHPQAMHHRVEQGAQDARALDFGKKFS
jgi:hypothetical protein